MISGGGNVVDNDKNGNMKLFTNGVDSFSNGFAENNRVTFSAYNSDTTFLEYNARRNPVKITQGGNETRYSFFNGLGFPKNCPTKYGH